MSESQARARAGVAVARQQVREVRATPLRVVSGSDQESQQRFWITARGD